MPIYFVDFLEFSWFNSKFLKKKEKNNDQTKKTHQHLSRNNLGAILREDKFFLENTDL